MDRGDFSDAEADRDKTKIVDESGEGAAGWKRIGKYFSLRLVVLFLTAIVAVYILILVANMGGAVDEIREAQIREQVGMQMRAMSDEMADWSSERRREYEESLVEQERQRLGLDEPFILRSFIYLRDAVTLDLGTAEQLTSDEGSRRVQLIILERLPPTLMLTATSFIILFFSSVFLALILSRKYGSIVDRLLIILAPSSAAPSWFYGIFLILIFAALLGWFPWGGMVDAPPPEDTLPYALSVMRHLVLPVGAWVLSAIFINIYQYRTFFLIYSSEDYVEVGKAKGLTNRALERKYILRPTIPPILTNFMMTAITLIMGNVILEEVFNWPGLGRLIFQAINLFDIPIVIGVNIIFAYLLAITIFILDIFYALLDPRVRVGSDKGGM